MKALISILILITFAIFLGSCKDSGPVINSPVNQTDKMVFTMTGSADGLTTAPMGMNMPYRHFEGTGVNTPGGQVQVILDYVAIPITSTNGGAGFGNGTLITQNGDKIYATNLTGTYVVNSITNVVTCDVNINIAGGTGEYDNLIGELHLDVTINEDRTTHGEWTGTFTHAKPFSGEFVGNNGTVLNPTCDPGYSRRHAEGSGIVLHLGNCSVVTEHCINFSTGFLKNGDGQFIANNGDKIYATYNGYGFPIPGTNKASVKMFGVITGGSGKYVGAKGYLVVNVIQEMPNGVAIANFDGVLDW